MPGLLLCFVMRYDKYKRMQSVSPETESKLTYFHCSLIGYIVGKSGDNFQYFQPHLSLACLSNPLTLSIVTSVERMVRKPIVFV